MAKASKKSKTQTQKKNVSKQKKAKASKTDWPKKTNVLFRPDRYKYVKSDKKDRPKDCVFCVTAKEPVTFESLCLFKNSFAQVVMNKFPYNAGHLLVLPIRHEGDLIAIREEELREIYQLSQKCVAALTAEYSPQGFNIGSNLGASAGAGIPEHLHFHIVPRWNGDTNFFPLLAETKVIIEDLEKTYERLKKYFQS